MSTPSQVPSPNPEPFNPRPLSDEEPPNGTDTVEDQRVLPASRAYLQALKIANGDPHRTIAEMAKIRPDLSLKEVAEVLMKATIVAPSSASGLCFFDPRLEPPSEPAVYEGLLSATDQVAWIGREKHRKTNVLLQLSICAALGQNFLNFRFGAPRPLRVVFIDYESKTRSLKNRYQSICRSMSLSSSDEELVRKNLQILEVRRMRQEGKYFPRFPLKDTDKRETEFWKRLIAEHPADFYLIDPMRCFHASEENDSTIEQLMERMRIFFGSAALIISHHMRKRSGKDDSHESLLLGMREWSDGARGSGAIKAHADVIVCQERVIKDSTETVYLGAFMKDGADIEPVPLVESDYESFFFKPSFHIPSHLQDSYDILRGSAPFSSRSAAAAVLQGNGAKRATAFDHVRQLAERGLLVESEDRLKVSVC